MKITGRVLLTVGLMLGATAAYAQDQDAIPEPMEPSMTTQPGDPTYAPILRTGPGTEHLRTPMGVSLQVGGGVTNFVSESTREGTDVGGYWDVRAVVGTRSFVALELAYLGQAQDIQAPGLDPDAYLLGNGVEGALRLQAPFALAGRYLLAPFGFVGLGWTRYDLANDDFNTSAVANDDNVLTVPLGAGVAFGYQGFVADARFTYRPTFDDDRLFPAGDDFADLQNWAVGAMVGYEF
jgi:hypothetical protein